MLGGLAIFRGGEVENASEGWVRPKLYRFARGLALAFGAAVSLGTGVLRCRHRTRAILFGECAGTGRRLLNVYLQKGAGHALEYWSCMVKC